MDTRKKTRITRIQKEEDLLGLSTESWGGHPESTLYESLDDTRGKNTPCTQNLGPGNSLPIIGIPKEEP